MHVQMSRSTDSGGQRLADADLRADAVVKCAFAGAKRTTGENPLILRATTPVQATKEDGVWKEPSTPALAQKHSLVQTTQQVATVKNNHAHGSGTQSGLYDILLCC